MTSSTTADSAAHDSACCGCAATQKTHADRVAWIMFVVTGLVCAGFIGGIIAYVF